MNSVCILESSSEKLLVVSLDSRIMADFCSFLYSLLNLFLIWAKKESSYQFPNIYHFYLIEITDFTVKICKYPPISQMNVSP